MSENRLKTAVRGPRFLFGDLFGVDSRPGRMSIVPWKDGSPMVYLRLSSGHVPFSKVLEVGSIVYTS